MNTVALDSLMRDLYPAPGERVKLWVVGARREDAWVRNTCPRVLVKSHKDNTGADCRNAYHDAALWVDLAHDCCHACCDLQDATESRPDVAAWLELKASRPPVTTDRDALSEEIALDPRTLANPLGAFLRRLP